MDARVARVPYVVVPPHNVKRQISSVKTSDCTHGRCGRRSVTTLDEVEPASHSQHQCEQLEQDLMAKYKDKCVCQFRNAPHLPLHVLPFALARVEGHRIRTASGLAKIAHSFRLDPRHHPITSSRRGPAVARFSNRFAISFEENEVAMQQQPQHERLVVAWGKLYMRRTSRGIKGFPSTPFF